VHANLPLIIGHRGSSAVAPENTLAAFERAIQDGADGIEFDVRLSRDHIPVVIHDATTKRTALQDLHVSALTASQLQRLDVSAFFQPAEDAGPVLPQGIPTLLQVFELFKKAGGVLYLEMKGEPVTETLVAQVAELIQAHQMRGRVVVESFDHGSLRIMKRLAPEIRTATLFESRMRRPSNLSNERILTAATDAGAEEIALHHTLVSNGLLRTAKDSGFEIVVWTADHPKWIARARDLGIKALITNNPAKMLAHRV
jgi:glycerophosphoryl diester phosphodiesterase